jgi:hypothetical protein
VIDDDVLHAFAVVGDPQEVAKGLQERCDGVVDRITLYTTYEAGDAIAADVVGALRG